MALDSSINRWTGEICEQFSIKTSLKKMLIIFTIQLCTNMTYFTLFIIRNKNKFQLKLKLKCQVSIQTHT